MTPMLEVKNLVKKFKKLTAVDKVSFRIAKGICFGLLGPNGAGKTTTIEVIEGVESPHSGDILYKGEPRSASFKEEIGIQFQTTALLLHLSVKETLRTFQDLYEKTVGLEKLIEICHLKDIQNHPNDKLSGGQTQRVLLALALINDPELIFLDEPSTGLDPQARRNLWAIVEDIKQQGKTVVLTTHYMEEAEFLCDEIAIMDYGRIIAQGTPEELINRYCNDQTIVIPKENVENCLSFETGKCIETSNRFEIHTKDINASLRELMAQHVDLTDFIVRSPHLEDVFLTLTGRALRS